MYARTVPRRAFPSFGPRFGAKFAGNVETIEMAQIWSTCVPQPERGGRVRFGRPSEAAPWDNAQVECRLPCGAKTAQGRIAKFERRLAGSPRSAAPGHKPSFGFAVSGPSKGSLGPMRLHFGLASDASERLPVVLEVEAEAFKW